MDNCYSDTCEPRPGVVLGFGHPIVDLISQVDSFFLKKYKLKANSMVLYEDKVHNGIYDDLTKNYTAQLLPGGSTSNSIQVCQWILNFFHGAARSKSATTFSGSVGSDKFGHKFESALIARGVKPRLHRNLGASGACAVVITEKYRSLVTNLACAKIFPTEACNRAWSSVENARYIYISGFFINSKGGPEMIRRVASHCLEKDKVLIVNISAPFVPEVFPKELDELISFADIVIGNEEEAKAWGRVNGLEDASLEKIARTICNKKSLTTRPRTTIITQGKHQAIVCQENDTDFVPVSYVQEENIIDTNGAGDAFVGGLLAGLVQGKTLRDCAELGMRAAAMIIQCPSVTFPDYCTKLFNTEYTPDMNNNQQSIS